MKIHNTYAIAYTDMLENKTIVKLVKAESEIKAMINFLIDKNLHDDDFKNWTQSLKNLSKDEFVNECINAEIGIDVVKINR